MEIIKGGNGTNSIVCDPNGCYGYQGCYTFNVCISCYGCYGINI